MVRPKARSMRAVCPRRATGAMARAGLSLGVARRDGDDIGVARRAGGDGWRARAAGDARGRAGGARALAGNELNRGTDLHVAFLLSTGSLRCWMKSLILNDR